MTESIEINAGLILSLSSRLAEEGDDNDVLLGEIVSSRISLADTFLDTDEMAASFRERFHVSAASAETRAQSFLERTRQIAAANGNGTIDSQEEADGLFNFVTSEEAFLLAGGIVVHNNLSEAREVNVHLNCPGLTESDLRGHALPHEPWRYLEQMAMSFSAPVPGATDRHYLFNYLQVSFANRVIPAVNVLAFSRSGEIFRADWSLVDADDAGYATLVREHRAEIGTALAAAGEDHGPEDIDTVMNDFIDLRDRVEASWGSHVVNESNGDFVHTQGSRVSMDSLAPDSDVIEATVETSLQMCGDSRGRSRPEIPAWIHEDGSTERGETVTPAD